MFYFLIAAVHTGRTDLRDCGYDSVSLAVTQSVEDIAVVPLRSSIIDDAFCPKAKAQRHDDLDDFESLEHRVWTEMPD